MSEVNFYVSGPKINVEAMRRAARKRSERDQGDTIIHLHADDERECNRFDENHEFYENTDG